MDDRFTRALQQLGHIYEPRNEGWTPQPQRIRHLEKVFVPTGEVLPVCGAEGTGISCPMLYLDANCEECRKIEGVPSEALTKRGLMIDLVNTLCDIEQMWLDAMYWNHHNPDKEPLNPDPDGVLAKAWIDIRMQIESMIMRFQPTMKGHEGRFGWPEEFNAEDES